MLLGTYLPVFWGSINIWFHFIIQLRTCDVQTVLRIVLCMLLSQTCPAYELLTKEGVDGSVSVFMFHLLLSGLLRLLADVDGQPGTDHPERNNGSETASLQPQFTSSLLVSRPTVPSVHWRVLYRQRAHRSVWRPPWSASTSLPLVHVSSRDMSA